ncbi:MAG: hypothetical protein IH598_17195 [Bacteroidales bacterium]|nr:hypothetical protein [Bacteroidales bacterium]
MITEDEIGVPENSDANHLANTGAKIDFCMRHYQPFLRQDFSLHHLSVITNIPEKDIEIFFSQSPKPFDQYLDEFRVKYAKNLIITGKVLGMEIKTIGALSGFSSAKKFIEAYILIEGISPETYQSQINKSN